MFTVKNLSPNALPMPDGTMLAPFGSENSSRDFEEINKQTRDFAKREWVQISEEKDNVPTGAAAPVEPPIIPADAADNSANSKDGSSAGGRRK